MIPSFFEFLYPPQNQGMVLKEMQTQTKVSSQEIDRICFLLASSEQPQFWFMKLLFGWLAFLKLRVLSSSVSLRDAMAEKITKGVNSDEIGCIIAFESF